MRQIGAADDAAERAVMQTFDIGLHQDLQHRFRDSLQEICVAALLQQRCFRSSQQKQAVKQTLRCRSVETCPVCVPALGKATSHEGARFGGKAPLFYDHGL
jgi:hypothetical protein